MDKHYLGEIAFGFGLLVSPTCDMYNQLAEDPRPAHPYRALVPILPLEEVAAATDAVEPKTSSCCARATACTPTCDLPALSTGSSTRASPAYSGRPWSPTTSSADPPRRIAQMNPEARPQLKIKLARYWARVDL